MCVVGNIAFRSTCIYLKNAVYFLIALKLFSDADTSVFSHKSLNYN